jgi:hypothetical protein
MVQLKGLLYRKLMEVAKTRKKEEKRIKKEITQETHHAVDELESFVNKDVKKVEHTVDAKLNHILKNLETLGRQNEIIFKQNQTMTELLKLLKKGKRIIISK